MGRTAKAQAAQTRKKTIQIPSQSAASISTAAARRISPVCGTRTAARTHQRPAKKLTPWVRATLAARREAARVTPAGRARASSRRGRPGRAERQISRAEAARRARARSSPSCLIQGRKPAASPASPRGYAPRSSPSVAWRTRTRAVTAQSAMGRSTWPRPTVSQRTGETASQAARPLATRREPLARRSPCRVTATRARAKRAWQTLNASTPGRAPRLRSRQANGSPSG
jgi:hypothetical protein